MCIRGFRSWNDLGWRLTGVCGGCLFSTTDDCKPATRTNSSPLQNHPTEHLPSASNQQWCSREQLPTMISYNEVIYVHRIRAFLIVLVQTPRKISVCYVFLLIQIDISGIYFASLCSERITLSDNSGALSWCLQIFDYQNLGFYSQNLGRMLDTEELPSQKVRYTRSHVNLKLRLNFNLVLKICLIWRTCKSMY